MAAGTSIDRRDFVKRSAGIGAAGIAAGSLAGMRVASADASAPIEGISHSALDDKWSFEIAPDPIGEDVIDETIEADVVVVGAGVSGLVTACSAAEEGLKVVVVTASEAPVCRL